MNRETKEWHIQKWLFLREEIPLEDAIIFVFQHPDFQWESGKPYELFKRGVDGIFVYASSHLTEEEARKCLVD